jgi:membrane protease YdiL (CAAX protease family)
MDSPTDRAKPALNGRDILKVLAVWISLSVVVATVSYMVMPALFSQFKDQDTRIVLIVAEVYALVPIACVITLGGIRAALRRLAIVMPPRKYYAQAVALFLGLSALGIGVYALIGVLQGDVWSPGRELIAKATDIARLPKATIIAWILIVLRVFVLAAIAEEIVFRGLLYGWLRQRLSVQLSIALTTLFFTAEHVFPIIFPLVILFGIAAAYLREKSGSLLPSIMLHILTDVSMLGIAYAIVSSK